MAFNTRLTSPLGDRLIFKQLQVTLNSSDHKTLLILDFQGQLFFYFEPWVNLEGFIMCCHGNLEKQFENDPEKAWKSHATLINEKSHGILLTL